MFWTESKRSVLPIFTSAHKLIASYLLIRVKGEDRNVGRARQKVTDLFMKSFYYGSSCWSWCSTLPLHSLISSLLTVGYEDLLESLQRLCSSIRVFLSNFIDKQHDILKIYAHYVFSSSSITFVVLMICFLLNRRSTTGRRLYWLSIKKGKRATYS
jgi:hypothetical protein